MKSKGLLPRVPDLLIPALALSGLGINLLLLARRYSNGAAEIAGCGGGPCEEVLASRWSVILGVPVTVFGVLAYAALIVCIMPRLRHFGGPLLGMIAGAAAWFVFVQVVLLGKICPWCMAAHGIGILLFGLGILRSGMMTYLLKWALTAFLAIGLAQVYGPVPSSHRIEEIVVPSAANAVFSGGRISVEIAAVPRFGPIDAKHVMVEYFDYQCAACRKMSDYLEAFTAKHSQDVVILLLPVPLDDLCNDHVSPGNLHPGSCEITRIALTVWRSKPGVFPAFHRKLMENPSIALARELAFTVAGVDPATPAPADPWIDQLIKSNIAAWHSLSRSNPKLPKLLVSDKRILHGLPASEAEFIKVMESELGL